MIQKEFIDGGDLFVTRVRVVLENDPITGYRRTAHENNIGYRLFFKKNEKIYIDILSGKAYPVLTENLKEHELFILDPKPFWNYASNLRAKEKIGDVKEIAKYVTIHFNKYMHNQEKWYEVKKELHKIHHKNDDDLIF